MFYGYIFADTKNNFFVNKYYFLYLSSVCILIPWSEFLPIKELKDNSYSGTVVKNRWMSFKQLQEIFLSVDYVWIGVLKKT